MSICDEGNGESALSGPLVFKSCLHGGLTQRSHTKGTLTTLWAAVSAAVLAWIVCFWRGERLPAWYPAPVKGTADRIVAVVFGFVAASVYGWVVASRLDTPAQICRWIGAGLATALSIPGFIGPSTLKKNGPVVAWTVMNSLWGEEWG